MWDGLLLAWVFVYINPCQLSKIYQQYIYSLSNGCRSPISLRDCC